MTCSLYRHFDADDRLLYVGVSTSAIVRLAKDHRSTARWFRTIARVEMQSFPTRNDALAAEAEAIRKEQPKFNRAGAIRH